MATPVKPSKTFNIAATAATIGVFSLMLQSGIQTGWTSPNLQRYKTGESNIKLSPTEISWVASITGLGGCLGAITGSLSVSYYGSKKTILITLYLIIFKWSNLLLATSVTWLFAFRFLAGVTSTMAHCCFSLYLGEISKPRVRGTLISIATIGYGLGITLGNVLESYVDTKISTWTYLILCCMTAMIFTWLQDSPYYLVIKGDVPGAETSIASYFPSSDMDDKLNEIKTFVETSTKEGLLKKIMAFTDPVARNSMILTILLYIIPIVGGAVVIGYYMVIILESTHSDFMGAKESNICIHLVANIFFFLNVKLIDTLGRRVVYIISSFGTAAAMIGLGIYFFLQKQNINMQYLQWLPVLCLLIYCMSFYVGYMAVPSIVLSELFPSNLKNVAACIAVLMCSLFSFITAKMYQPIVDALGEMYAFWLFALLSLIGVPVALILMPETKQKSFVEIQKELSMKR